MPKTGKHHGDGTGRPHEQGRLFAAGLVWALLLSAVFSRGQALWLPLTLLGVLTLVCSLWPAWRAPGSRVAWILAYGASFVWSWSHGQPGPRMPDWAYFAGVGLFAALAAWSARGGKGLSLWAVGLIGLGTLVSFFSGPSGGADPWLRFFQETLGLPPEVAQNLLFWSRKSTHFFGYGVFAHVAFREARAQGLGPRQAAWAALAWTAPHAVFDEIDQVFAGNRNGSFADVLVDWAGAVALVLPWARRPR